MQCHLDSNRLVFYNLQFQMFLDFQDPMDCFLSMNLDRLILVDLMVVGTVDILRNQSSLPL
jgi:hypothetical protein